MTNLLWLKDLLKYYDLYYPSGYSEAPVVTFAASSDVHTGDYDLKKFPAAASIHGVSNRLYIADIIFGFEIREDGAGSDLGVGFYEIQVE